MNYAIRPNTYALLVALVFTVLACSQPAARQMDETGRYEIGKPNLEGIGKFYMGREISHVMGYQGASWLERTTRDREEATSVLVESLPIVEDAVVADFGAGTGYFTFPMAFRAPKGRVFAVDVQQEMLDIIAARIERTGVENVIPVKGSVDSPNLPADTLDLVLIVDVYHELSHPYEVMRGIHEALKPGGKVVLIEYRAEDPTVPIKRLHKMTEAQARKELEAAGFIWVETRDMLPQQHFMVFEKG